MAKAINITIKNKLEIEKRDMTIYHHFARSAHMISHNSSITISLMPIIEGDYLHISIVSGPGNLLNQSVFNLPSWADFELFSAGNIMLSHSNGRVLLKIPPGPPIWQLKMKQSLSNNNKPADIVIISDDPIPHQRENLS